MINIEEIKKKSIITIDVPGWDEDVEHWEVQKPRMMAMILQGKIPNHLMGVADKMIKGSNTNAEKLDVKEMGKMFEIYCLSCMVSPTYEEIKDFMTDEQMNLIIAFATGGVQALENFRSDRKDGTDNNDGKGVQV